MVDAVRAWTAGHGLRYETPQQAVTDVGQAIDRLARLGLTPKSVEGLSMFADVIPADQPPRHL